MNDYLAHYSYMTGGATGPIKVPGLTGGGFWDMFKSEGPVEKTANKLEGYIITFWKTHGDRITDFSVKFLNLIVKISMIFGAAVAASILTRIVQKLQDKNLFKPMLDKLNKAMRPPNKGGTAAVALVLYIFLKGTQLVLQNEISESILRSWISTLKYEATGDKTDISEEEGKQKAITFEQLQAPPVPPRPHLREAEITKEEMDSLAATLASLEGGAINIMGKSQIIAQKLVSTMSPDLKAKMGLTSQILGNIGLSGGARRRRRKKRRKSKRKPRRKTRTKSRRKSKRKPRRKSRRSSSRNVHRLRLTQKPVHSRYINSKMMYY